MRYTIGALCLAPLVAMREGAAFPPRSDWPLVFVSAALQMAAFSALMAIALLTLPPGRASVLAYTTPIWVVPLAAWWLGERFSRRAAAGIVLGLTGVVVIALPSVVQHGREQLAAYALLLASALVWAVSIVFVRAHRFTATAFALAPWQMIIAALMLLPFAWWLEGQPPALDATGTAVLAFIGPVSTGFAYWAVVEAGRHFKAGTMSVALLATPSLGIIISALTMGEVIGPSLVAGVMLIGIGIWLTASGEQEPRRVQAAAGTGGDAARDHP